MKRLINIGLVAAGLAAITGGLALAQDRPAVRDGGPGLFARGPGAARVFTRLDRDHDGAVTLDEALTGPMMRFEDADTDKNGVVTREELDAALQKRLERIRDRMLSRLDVDKDGTISRAEAETPVKKRFALFDRNDDGKVTRDEIRRGGPHRDAPADPPAAR